MPDNITAPATGAVLATDEVGGVHFPRTKLTVGVDGAAVDVSGTNPLPIAVASLPLPTGAATTAAVASVGTRAYGTALTRVAVAAASAQSAAIAATEVLLHASTRCFVAIGANPTATVNDIPLEAGEKFHARLTSGHRVAVLRDAADGFLNIVPVA